MVLGTTWLAERLRWSGPLLLMLGSVLPFVHVPEMEPEFVLVVLLPPLLYASAVNTSLVDFRRHLASIGWLSVGLVLITIADVGLVVGAVLGVPLAAALALGAVVAPPDAVAATAVARRMGLPRRVVTLLEGESLGNDATALVGLRSALLALSAALSVGASSATSLGRWPVPRGSDLYSLSDARSRIERFSSGERYETPSVVTFRLPLGVVARAARSPQPKQESWSPRSDGPVVPNFRVRSIHGAGPQ